MNILGIESSCDETSAAVVNECGQVLSCVVASQIPVHARYGGVVPELASRNHLMAILPVIRQALSEADQGFDDIGRIAVTNGPGLMGSLLVGVQAAKTLAMTRNLPLVPVHHVEGHITAVFLEGGDMAEEPVEFPYLALAVSGGHTSLYLAESFGEYKRVGTTLDDAAGEAFDKVAKLLSLPYPGGVAIDRVAKTGANDAYRFPRAMPGKKNFLFSFSGLKTAVRNQVQKLGELDAQTVADVGASFQEAVVDSLVKKTVAAADHLKVRHVVISGGVAANSRLREKFAEATGEKGLVLHTTAMKYCTDNAAMIAGVGLRREPVSFEEALALGPFASGELGVALAEGET